MDAPRYFEDPDVSLAFVASCNWPDGVGCPRCGSAESYFLSTRRLLTYAHLTGVESPA